MYKYLFIVYFIVFVKYFGLILFPVSKMDLTHKLVMKLPAD